MVFSQSVIDIAHEVTRILVDSVVVSASAAVTTKFLVFAAYNPVGAFRA